MNIQDYNFKVGDTVITTIGEVGKITGICYCRYCAERGFFEPTWRVETEMCDRYITKYDAECGFIGFYRIGDYHFDEFNKAELYAKIASYEKELKRLKKQLKVIEKFEREGKKCL